MNKCVHGVYDPHNDGAYCQLCNPAGNPDRDADTPKFNRRNSLSITSTGKLPKCPTCGGHAILTVSNGGTCAICQTSFSLDARADVHLRANNRQPGVCPECQSGVHYVLNAKTWQCVDCGSEYKAPKRTE